VLCLKGKINLVLFLKCDDPNIKQIQDGYEAGSASVFRREHNIILVVLFLIVSPSSMALLEYFHVFPEESGSDFI